MDISIKNLNSYVVEPKTESLRTARAEELTSKNFIATEKVDGTKLTLVRTNEESNDYRKNWIVAYKGTVLHASEFEHFTEKDIEDITKHSVGIGQYALIFLHLKNINRHIQSIPKSHEFSVEFAQNKDTLTRTYVRKGGMFLRSYGHVDYRIINGHLVTHLIGREETDQNRVESMAKIIGIASFPVFYNGKLNDHDLKMKSPAVWNHMSALGVDWKDNISIIDKFSKTMLEIPSILGGRTEGIVLKYEDGKFFKIVQQDQYDKQTRDTKKDTYRMDNEKTAIYFQQIRALLRSVISKIGNSVSPEKKISLLNNFVSKLSDSDIPKHEKKSPIQVRDDIHDTIRLLVSKGDLLNGNKTKTKTIGLIPVAAKPLHIGHWKLIEKASRENDTVVIYTSTKDRIKNGEFPIHGNKFAKFWADYFIPYLPKNVKVKIVESPILSVGHELAWFEQLLNLDKVSPPTINIYSDKKDAEDNFAKTELSKYISLNKYGKINVIGVDRHTTVNISGTQMRHFLMNGDKESFMKNMPPIPRRDKEAVWDSLIKDAPSDVVVKKPEDEQMNPMKEFINELISEVLKDMLSESGASTAMVDPKTSKTVNGEEARASTKLSIVDRRGKDIHNHVSDDIKLLATTLNHKVGFWKKDNPYIQNGHIFNGSSQFLMDPEKRGKLIGVKNTFGDVDIIIPKQKLDSLEKFLDSIDDNKVEWKKTPKNSITTAFQYVGRTKSYASIPDQLVTLWYYQPAGHVVQIDFEGDEMTIDPQGFEKPSEWTKFSKDSPWEDLTSGIKGLAGALMLRSLARSTSHLKDAVVLTGRGIKNVQTGVTELKDSDVSLSAQHSVPSKYTLNTGGGGAGIREAYKFVKKVTYKGKVVNAYRFVEAKETTPEERITDVGRIFEVIFGKPPSGNEKSDFRSFQGQLRLMKKYLKKPVIDMAVKRFVEILANEPLNDKERGSIANAAKSILGVSI